MGARVVFNLKQSDDLYLCLYSHWGEGSCLEDLATALDKARPRWDDETYCSRIIISSIIGEEWNQETGYGLWASPELCNDETWIQIDLKEKTVIAIDGEHSFSDFVNYHAKAGANS